MHCMALMGRRSAKVSNLVESYAICKDITRAASTSFLRSFRHLPIEKETLFMLSTRSVVVDDIADGLPDLSDISPEKMSDLEVRTADRSVILRSISNQRV